MLAIPYGNGLTGRMKGIQKRGQWARAAYIRPLAGNRATFVKAAKKYYQKTGYTESSAEFQSGMEEMDGDHTTSAQNFRLIGTYLEVVEEEEEDEDEGSEEDATESVTSAVSASASASASSGGNSKRSRKRKLVEADMFRYADSTTSYSKYLQLLFGTIDTSKNHLSSSSSSSHAPQLRDLLSQPPVLLGKGDASTTNNATMNGNKARNRPMFLLEVIHAASAME